MKADFEVVKCAPESREEALGLLSRLWTTNLDVNRRCWAWKYDRNPAAAGQRVYLALERGRVIGMRGFSGALWEVARSGGTLWAPCAGDTVVARQCESRGVFRAIMDVAQAELHAEGHPFMFNLSAGPTIFLRSLRGGWRPVPGTYERWSRPGNSEHRRDLGLAA
jgi:GNAT superfamily N-acetyltransferase